MPSLSEHHVYYQKAILLNNTAVYQVENGNYEKARLLFRDALKALRSSTVEEYSPEGQQQQSSSSCCDNNNPVCKRNRLHFEWSRNAPLHAELNLPSPTPDTSYIFRRALFLTDRESNNNNNSSSSTVLKTKCLLHHNDTVEESKAIIYNLALSYLLSGFININSSLLEKSRQLFEKIIYFILCSSDDNVDPKKKCPDKMQKSNNDYLLEAAVCNNLGWLNEEFCNYQLSQACYNEVYHRMEILIRTGCLERQEWKGFIENLWRGDTDSHHLAAAA